LFGTKKRDQQLQMAISHAVDTLTEQVQDAQQALSGSADAVLEQLNKLGRLQYKTSRESADHLQKLMAGVEELVRGQSETQQLGLRVTMLEQQVEGLLRDTLRWMDDLDVLRDSLDGAAREVWLPMVEQWTERLLAQLDGAGFREIPVTGAIFDPRWSEAVGTVEPDMATTTQPYEVVKVVRRGFIGASGTVLRKAQVITVQGADYGEGQSQ
jgi:molecular chaperone GrpE (heat shock protein)